MASHSHFVMDDVLRTPAIGRTRCCLAGSSVLPAQYATGSLRESKSTPHSPRTDVSGFLLATVMSDGSIQFDFQELTLDDLRIANAGKTPDSLVHWCFNENQDQKIPPPNACR